MKAFRIVVMGVSGSGKSTLGAALAARIGARFIDSDDLHPPANIAKMSRGEPLTDADRRPWLARVAGALAAARADRPVVVACSALKRAYRASIAARAGEGVVFLHLAAPQGAIAPRLAARQGHFMPAALLDSQYATLEPPGPDEPILAIPADRPPEAVLAAALAALGA